MMNQNVRAIKIVVDILKQHNIRQIVISPGGTNVALVQMVQEDDFFECHSIVDERSAMYYAIGLYLQKGEIIAMSCTSAQATRNYIPGLTEAFYKRVPILAITMEKHPRFIGQEYMQAPDQTSLPRDSVKKTFEVPYISCIHDEYACIRIANEAMAEVKHRGFGPVQLCIPWLDFELKDHKPKTRMISRYYGWDENMSLSGKRILIVIGEHRPFSMDEKSAIEEFSKSHDCIIYTNHLSNYDGQYSLWLNPVLSAIDFKTLSSIVKPDIVISIGGQTGDYPLYLFLSRPELLDIEHWRVSEDGRFIDTYDKLTKVFECDIKSFFLSAVGDDESSHNYYYTVSTICARFNTSVNVPFSNAFAAQTLHNALPRNSIIQFSILHSLRIWNLFSIDPSIECYSNVGAFGIDGGMSTLIGQSIATEKMCFMITGDLAFYYDMNALGIRGIKSNLRILLINNNGGVEFKLNHRNHTKTDLFIAAANHFKDAKGWAETCGFSYLSATTKSQFLSLYKQFITTSDKPILFELFVTDKNDYDAYQTILDANRAISVSGYLKKELKRIIYRT